MKAAQGLLLRQRRRTVVVQIQSPSWVEGVCADSEEAENSNSVG